MKSDTNEQEDIRRYLLGRVPPQDLAAFEERYFLDSELYEELSIVEDELIDEYLRGELSPSDRERFESHFMSAPERQEKMRFARALKKYVSAEVATQPQKFSTAAQLAEDVSENTATRRQRRPPFSFLPFQNPIVSYSLAAAIVLVLVGVSWTVWKNSPTRDPGKVLAVTLTPGLSRSEGETARLNIPADIGTVRLQLLLPANQYQSYEAVLRNAEGHTLLTEKNLGTQSVTDRQPVVLFDVPSSLLPPGDYRIRLSGVNRNGLPEVVESYSFRISR